MRSGRGVTESSSGSARRRADARAEGAVGEHGAVGDDGAVGEHGAGSDDPFARLGLPARPGLCDDDVRAAWRRVAAATHPDREDGGDPARFGAAAAAYVMLRTGFGRGEALADLGLSGATDTRGRHAHRRGRSADSSAEGAGRHRARRDAPAGRRRWPLTAPDARWPRRAGWSRRWRSVGSRLRRAPKRRPGRLALRVAGAAAVGVAAVVISGWSPGVVGVLAGVLTWLLATARHARARRRSR
jgi:hypothetical protein